MPERRTAVVIGGGRGIGAATAAALAATGHDVTILDRASPDPRLPYPLAMPEDLERAAAAAREAGGSGCEVSSAAVDAGDEPGLRSVVDDIEARAGGLDVVVVASGVIAGGVPAWELAERELDAVIDINLRAVITAARVFVPALLRRPEPRTGRFLAVASAAAVRGLPMLAAYCAAKAGVVGFVRALAAELQGSGVTANTVSPGSTDTAILAEAARLYALDDASAFARQQPIKRLIEPSEVGAVIAFLSGPDSGAITGSDYAVDGGLSI